MTHPASNALSAAHAVALIGFMGTGKSVIGRAAAGLLGVPYVDTDQLIERRHGPIPEIFALHGEQVFRELERDVACAALADALAQPCVISLGGGAVLSSETRAALARLTHVVWLTAPRDVLWQRVRHAGAAGRPLAVDEQRFARLFDERAALYASVATTQLVNDGTRPLSAVAAEVARIATTDGRAEGRPR